MAASSAKQAMYSEGIQTAGHLLCLDMRAVFVAATEAATSRTSKQLTELGRSIARGAVNGAETAKIHERIGKDAHAATMKSYAGYRARGGPSGYRRGAAVGDRGPTAKRFSGGVLKTALASKKFYKADSDSLSLIHLPTLNSKAEQWARLNFGAGAAGGAGPKARRFPIQISNMIIAELGIVNAKPRAEFFVPTGYFVDGSGPVKASAGSAGKHAFYVAGQGKFPQGRGADNGEGNRSRMIKMQMTRGIRAEHFLDNALAVVARDFGPSYVRLVRQMAKDGTANVKATSMPFTNKPTPKPPRIKRSATYGPKPH